MDAKQLAGKLAKAAQTVNTPDRNARSMFVDEGFWKAVAEAILEAVTPKAEAEEVPAAEAEEDDYVDLDELKAKATPKKRGRRK